MCACIYYIYTFKIQKGIEKDPSQVGVTIPCDTGIRGSALLVPPPLHQLACSLRVDIFSILPLMRLSLFLMETLTSRRKWGLALWVLRLRHRALRNRCGGRNKKRARGIKCSRVTGLTWVVSKFLWVFFFFFTAKSCACFVSTIYLMRYLLFLPHSARLRLRSKE